MSTSIQPIYYKTQETKGYLDMLASNIKSTVGKDSDLILDHPAVYVHIWQSKTDALNGRYSIYIGETNDIISRTKGHWAEAQIPKALRKKGNWQYHMLEDVDANGKKVVPTVYFFGHQYFHKSMTLDVENRLIDYCCALKTTNTYNGRTNPQGNYSGDENMDAIFSMIWKILQNDYPNVFLPAYEIQKSAIYKASPNHKLTSEQKEAKQIIIDRTIDAILKNKTGQLIFIEGEAGTGKTVLTSSTFYELLDNDLCTSMNLKAHMLINHEEQKVIYKDIAKKLGYNEDLVLNPTGFLKHHSILNPLTKTYEPDPSNIVDVVFVDEAHLLWNQRNQAYDRKFVYPQLDEIIRRSRVTVIMFDENQVLHRGQIFSMEYMQKMRKLAKSQGPAPDSGESNYYELKNQMRMKCSEETKNWIDALSKQLKVTPLSLNKNNVDKNGYEVKIFDNPSLMHKEIIAKAQKTDSKTSRMVATMDWEYINSDMPTNKWYWDVSIGNWSIPWHEEIYWRDIYWKISERERRRIKAMVWPEKDHSLYEAGSTFTVQGFDMAYIGIILGPSVRYDKNTNTIWFDEKYRAQNYMTGKRVLEDGREINVASIISKHEMRVLMTRGVKGMYIYACDQDLRQALKDAVS